MAAPRGLIPCRRVENIHGSLKSDEPVSRELPLGWRYAKRSLKIPEKYPPAVYFSLACGNRPLIRAKLSGIRVFSDDENDYTPSLRLTGFLLSRTFDYFIRILLKMNKTFAKKIL